MLTLTGEGGEGGKVVSTTLQEAGLLYSCRTRIVPFNT